MLFDSASVHPPSLQADVLMDLEAQQHGTLDTASPTLLSAASTPWKKKTTTHARSLAVSAPLCSKQDEGKRLASLVMTSWVPQTTVDKVNEAGGRVQRVKQHSVPPLKVHHAAKRAETQARAQQMRVQDELLNVSAMEEGPTKSAKLKALRAEKVRAQEMLAEAKGLRELQRRLENKQEVGSRTKTGGSPSGSKQQGGSVNGSSHTSIVSDESDEPVKHFLDDDGNVIYVTRESNPHTVFDCDYSVMDVTLPSQGQTREYRTTETPKEGEAAETPKEDRTAKTSKSLSSAVTSTSEDKGEPMTFQKFQNMHAKVPRKSPNYETQARAEKMRVHVMNEIPPGTLLATDELLNVSATEEGPRKSSKLKTLRAEEVHASMDSPSSSVNAVCTALKLKVPSLKSEPEPKSSA